MDDCGSRITTDAVDRAGAVYWASQLPVAIMKLGRDGIRTRLAGLAQLNFSLRFGEPIADGDASSARFGRVVGLTTDDRGFIYVSDSNRIRRISPTGNVQTIAGSPQTVGVKPGALPASLNTPAGLALNANGILYGVDLQEQLVFQINLN